MKKVKIVVIGPLKAGKTTFSNFISECTASFQNDTYNPTIGCRILEFEIDKVFYEGKNQSIEVELWDCSGDERFSNCWPAFSLEAHGIVLILDSAENNDTEIHNWFQYFIQRQGISDEQCLIVQSSRGIQNSKWRGLEELKKMKMVFFDLSSEDSQKNVKSEFTRFIGNLINKISKKQDEDELFILKG